jgi:uncharacterized membrane protein (UPF0182 family)
LPAEFIFEIIGQSVADASGSTRTPVIIRLILWTILCALPVVIGIYAIFFAVNTNEITRVIICRSLVLA